MKIHEYQGKELLAKFGIPVPRGIPAFTVQEAVEVAQKLGGSLWVVKAQIHAGGRGKGGGVKLARSIDEVRSHATAILGMQLKTHQTGPEGQKVRRLLIEDGADIKKEYYLAVLTDRATQKVAMMGSSEGGMDIEEVAHKTPEKIIKVFVDTKEGVTDAQAQELARGMGIPATSQAQAVDVLKKLYRCYMETDASLAEINPLILEGNGNIKALDAKFNFDSNALFRQPEIVAYRDLDEEDAAEVEASKHDLAYISLDGNIGCLVNGAGLAMATMDTIKLYGGEPANFLDVGGGASTEKVTEAFKIMLKNPNVKGILVNIFGGIMRCDTIAEGVVAACKAVNLNVPLVVRMKGTNEDLGKKILADSGLPIISANTMAEAAEKVVAAVAKPQQVKAVGSTTAAATAVAAVNSSVDAAATTKIHSGPGMAGVAAAAGAAGVAAGVVGSTLGGAKNTVASGASTVAHAAQHTPVAKKGGLPWWLWLIGALILGLILWRSCSGPTKTASVPEPAPQAAPAVAAAALGQWQASSDGKIWTLEGKVKDQAAKDSILAAAKQNFGEANVVDKLTLDGTLPAHSQADWNGVFGWLKGNPKTSMQVATDKVVFAGEGTALDSAAMGTWLGAGVTVDKQMKEFAQAASQDADICKDKAAAVKISFVTGKAQLSATSMQAIKAQADKLNTCQDVKIEIGGHTDNVGKPELNQKLSQARAEAVLAQLVKAGVAKDRLSAKGYGDTVPVADNASAEGKAQNRRVEFVAQ